MARSPRLATAHVLYRVSGVSQAEDTCDKPVGNDDSVRGERPPTAECGCQSCCLTEALRHEVVLLMAELGFTATMRARNSTNVCRNGRENSQEGDQ